MNPGALFRAIASFKEDVPLVFGGEELDASSHFLFCCRARGDFGKEGLMVSRTRLGRFLALRRVGNEMVARGKKERESLPVHGWCVRVRHKAAAAAGFVFV